MRILIGFILFIFLSLWLSIIISIGVEEGLEQAILNCLEKNRKRARAKYEADKHKTKFA